MATSKDTSPLQVIKNSVALFAKIPKQLKACHDYLLKSGLFTKEEILNVDTSAISFSDLGVKTTALANVTSSQWLDTVVLYHENLKTFDESDSDILKQQLIGQASDLNKAFQVISVWAISLSQQFEEKGAATTKKSEEIVSQFESAQKEAKRIQQDAVEQAKKATNVYKEARDEAAKGESAFHLVKNLCPCVKVPSAGQKVQDPEDPLYKARQQKLLADEHLKEATQKLKTAESNVNKAKVIASKVAELFGLLKSLASTCEVIATYWSTEGEKLLVGNFAGASESNLDFWNGAKSYFEKYASLMAGVNTLNFQTDAKLPPYQTLDFKSVAFKLEVPADLDVTNIMAD